LHFVENCRILGHCKHFFSGMKKKIIIVGAGGHAKVVLDTILKIGDYEVIGFADDHLFTGMEVSDGYHVIASTNSLHNFADCIDFFIVAIGDTKVRSFLYQTLKNSYGPATIIRPDATIAKSVEIGPGTVILAQSVVNAHVVIGENCLINSLCLIDHGSVIGEHSHIAQGTIIGSDVQIPAMCVTELGEKIPSFSHKRSLSYM
jgi:sugar O-acyltransferase (sialic acid O-acetyltransferase NeuD family)